MALTFTPAKRESAKLLIGLCGPSGSGKTFSALKLATGLGGTIVYIDTEQGRALQYAEEFAFLHGELTKPFTPARYTEALDDALAAKPDVLIVDSMSHVWEGPGGVLEMVDRARGTGNDFSIWAKPKQEHQKLLNRLIQLPCHVIMCFRAKEKKALGKDERGKNVVLDIGWQPIAEHSTVYEMTINLLLSSAKKGTPIVEGFDAGKLPVNMVSLVSTEEPLGEETGRRLADWCRGAGIAERPVQTREVRQLILHDAAGADISVFPSFGAWLDALERAADGPVGVKMLNTNLARLTELVNNPKAPEAMLARARALYQRAWPSEDAPGDDPANDPAEQQREMI